MLLAVFGLNTEITDIAGTSINRYIKGFVYI